MTEWNCDMSKAPYNGILVFGCSAIGPYVMYFVKDSQMWINRDTGKPVHPFGWLEIPPINQSE